MEQQTPELPAEIKHPPSRVRESLNAAFHKIERRDIFNEIGRKEQTAVLAVVNQAAADAYRLGLEHGKAQTPQDAVPEPNESILTRVERIAREHNGVMTVSLHFGHDGDRTVRFHSYDGPLAEYSCDNLQRSLDQAERLFQAVQQQREQTRRKQEVRRTLQDWLQRADSGKRELTPEDLRALAAELEGGLSVKDEEQ